MKRLLTVGAASIAVLLLIVMPVAGQAPQAEKTFSGTLMKVDAANKLISVKGTGKEPEMTFLYDAKTQVTGAEKTVEGLAGKSGAMLKVTYREEGANRIAKRIEFSEAKKYSTLYYGRGQLAEKKKIPPLLRCPHVRPPKGG